MQARSFGVIGRGVALAAVGIAGIASIIASGGGGGSGSTSSSGTSATIYPRYALVANRGDNSVSTYVVDATTGRLKWIAKATAGAGAFSVAVDPAGKYAYIANSTTNTVSQFTIGADGALSVMSPNTVTVGTHPHSVAVDPSGKYVYVANLDGGGIYQFTIGPTGALAAMTPPTVIAGTNPYSITIDPSGKYAYVVNYGGGNVWQYTIGPTGDLSGAIPSVVAAGTSPTLLAIDPSGKYAYVTNSGDATVSAYTIGVGGVLTNIPCVSGGGVFCTVSDFTAGGGAASIAVDPSGKYVYVGNSGSGVDTVSQYAIGSGGKLVQMSPATVAAGTAPYSVSVDPSGKYVYVANVNSNNVSQYSIGPSGGLSALSPDSAGARSGPVGITLTSGTVAVQAVAKYGYVSNSTAVNVSQYTIGTNGTLSSNGTATGSGAGMNSVAADRSGSYVYITNVNNDAVSAYGIDVSTGVLGQISCSSGCVGSDFAVGTAPTAVTVDPVARYVYVANGTSNSVSVYSIPTNGVLSRISCSSGCVGSDFAAGTGPSAVTVDPSGKFVYVANATSGSVSAYSINILNGSLARISCSSGCSGSDFTAGTTPSSVAVEPSGKYLYATNSGSDSVTAFSIDASTGAVTRISCTSGCSGSDFATGATPSSVAVDPSGKYAYVANSNAISVAAFSINSSTGALTRIGCTSGCSGSDFATGNTPSSVSVDPSGKFVYVTNKSDNSVSQFRIGTNGALTAITTAVASGSGPSSIATIGTWQ